MRDREYRKGSSPWRTALQVQKQRFYFGIQDYCAGALCPAAGLCHGLLLLRRRNDSVAKHDLRSRRHGGRCRNLCIGVVGTVQLGFSLGLISEDEAGSRNLFICQRLLHVDDEVGDVGILGVLGHGHLDYRCRSFDHNSRNRRRLVLQHSPRAYRRRPCFHWPG